MNGWQFHEYNMPKLEEAVRRAPEYGVNFLIFSHGWFWSTEGFLASCDLPFDLGARGFAGEEIERGLRGEQFRLAVAAERQQRSRFLEERVEAERHHEDRHRELDAEQGGARVGGGVAGADARADHPALEGLLVPAQRALRARAALEVRERVLVEARVRGPADRGDPPQQILPAQPQSFFTY
jgi:hypothetical protein